jgi:hypothetical protein
MKTKMKISDPMLCTVGCANELTEELNVIQKTEWTRIVGEGD